LPHYPARSRGEPKLLIIRAVLPRYSARSRGEPELLNERPWLPHYHVGSRHGPKLLIIRPVLPHYPAGGTRELNMPRERSKLLRKRPNLPAETGKEP